MTTTKTATLGPTCLRVLAAIIQRPGSTLRQIAEAVGRCVANVVRQVHRLCRLRLVTWEPGKYGTLRATCRFLPAAELG